MNQSKKKVFIMLSGGVDSSVAALDLVQQGYDVIGVFMKCWSIDRLKDLGVDEKLYGCFWEEDSRDAALVAETLGIPFYVWDFQDRYKKAVVDYMIREYQSGRTPNPDVMCNSAIKFGIFYDKAVGLGADYVATGHYARIGDYELPDSSTQKIILRGKDSNKDQSYFLNRVDTQKLNKVLFPIGEYKSKSEVRKRAQKHKLITAAKKDSQGLCFIGETPLRELLIQTIGKKEGDIIDLNGKQLGKHPGAALYTIGQRNKLGLSGGPWYVARIDIQENTVTVAHQDQQEVLLGSQIQTEDCNYFIPENCYDSIQNDSELQGQIRYRQSSHPLVMKIHGDSFEAQFKTPIQSISPGQSLVIYDDDAMIASGVIAYSR